MYVILCSLSRTQAKRKQFRNHPASLNKSLFFNGSTDLLGSKLWAGERHHFRTYDNCLEPLFTSLSATQWFIQSITEFLTASMHVNRTFLRPRVWPSGCVFALDHGINTNWEKKISFGSKCISPNELHCDNWTAHKLLRCWCKCEPRLLKGGKC